MHDAAVEGRSWAIGPTVQSPVIEADSVSRFHFGHCLADAGRGVAKRKAPPDRDEEGVVVVKCDRADPARKEGHRVCPVGPPVTPESALVKVAPHQLLASVIPEHVLTQIVAAVQFLRRVHRLRRSSRTEMWNEVRPVVVLNPVVAKVEGAVHRVPKRLGPGEIDHLPPDEVLVPAVHGVGIKSLPRVQD